METAQRIDYAFRAFWAERGVTGMESLKIMSKVCRMYALRFLLLVAKTFIAVNSIKAIFNAIHRHNPKRPEFVVWLVPSLTILDQTVKALSDINHPYRQQLNLQFRNRVCIYQKKICCKAQAFHSTQFKVSCPLWS